jgi:hypothetical protein
MIVGPMATVIGPSFGGTNVSSGSAVEAGGAAAGVESACAAPAAAARPTRLRTVAATGNFRLSIN